MAWSFALLLAGGPLAAQHAPATTADVRLVQAEADLLDESLLALPDDAPRAAELRRRERELRTEIERLAAEVDANRRTVGDDLGASKAEMEDLRREIVALRTDVEQAGAAGAERAVDVDVPDGTQIEVRLDQALSSREARPEDRVTARVAESVRVDGRLAIPAGATIEGTVRSVEPARRPAHGGSLELAFDTLAVGGQRTRMSARVVSVEEDSLDKSKAGIGALVGGVLGAIVDGKKGALVGALVGGTGAVVATRGDDVELPAGTRLTLRLDRPVRMSGR